MFQWGIMGGGNISSQFAAGIEKTEGMSVYALASQSGRNGFGIKAEKYYATYEDLAADPRVDAVYVGTIHPQHLPCVRICLEAGKPVLCEKPIAMNTGELEEMLGLAEKKQTFFMEAMWSRYLPAVREMKRIAQEEIYGKVQYLHITFGSQIPKEVRRIYEADLGGGALLDVGVYGVNLADYWLGVKEKEIHAWAQKLPNTVDVYTGVQILYENGAAADLVFATDRKLPNSGVIVTDKAELVMPYFWRPTEILRYKPNGNFASERLEERLSFSLKGNGYPHEALEVKRCVEEGLLESPDMTWEDSRRIMTLLDEIRRQSGIRYPQDETPSGYTCMSKKLDNHNERD